MKFRRPFKVLSVIAVLATPATARASGISVARFGGEHGHPTTTNATALFYNPAGIASEPGGRIYGDLVLAWRNSTYEKDPRATDDPLPADGEGANTGEGRLFNVLVNPMAGVTYQIDRLAFGFGAFTPYGGQSAWSRRDAFEDSPYPGAVDGPQRWYSIEGELRSTFFTAGVAYDFGRVSVGAALNLIWSVTNTVRARDPAGGNRLTNEGRSWIDTSGLDPSFGVGVLWEAVPERLFVGASYQSRPNLGGGMQLRGDLHNVFANGSRSDDAVDFHTDLPDVLRAGVRGRASEEIELRLFGDYQRWSVLENHCVTTPDASCDIRDDGSATGTDVILNQVRNWNDTFGVRVGGSYFVDERLELFAGTGLSTNAVPDETLEPALPDFTSMHVAAGARHEVVDDVRVAASYNQVFYFSRDTRGDSIHPQLVGPSRGPDSGGQYRQILGFFDVNVEVAF